MPYITLARKCRPQKFSQVVGQRGAVEVLCKQVEADKVPHAFLFAGPRGVGKTSIARILAKVLNCQGREKNSGEPCGECKSCLSIVDGTDMDVVEMDAASNRGIDDVRQISRSSGYSPTSKKRYRVFIIDEAHMLTEPASNAFLKLLEEPHAHLKFVFCTTELQKILPTVISRCQVFTFRKLSVPEITGSLEKTCKESDVKYEILALEELAIMSDGSLRDAQVSLETVLLFDKVSLDLVREIFGIVDRRKYFDYFELVLSGRALEAIAFFREQDELGVDLVQFCFGLASYMRDLMVIRISENLVKYQGFMEFYKKQTNRMPLEKTEQAIRIISDCHNRLSSGSLAGRIDLSLEVMTAELLRLFEMREKDKHEKVSVDKILDTMAEKFGGEVVERLGKPPSPKGTIRTAGGRLLDIVNQSEPKNTFFISFTDILANGLLYIEGELDGEELLKKGIIKVKR